MSPSKFRIKCLIKNEIIEGQSSQSASIECKRIHDVHGLPNHPRPSPSLPPPRPPSRTFHCHQKKSYEPIYYLNRSITQTRFFTRFITFSPSFYCPLSRTFPGVTFKSPAPAFFLSSSLEPPLRPSHTASLLLPCLAPLFCPPVSSRCLLIYPIHYYQQ